jgi:hypothetical protein
MQGLYSIIMRDHSSSASRFITTNINKNGSETIVVDEDGSKHLKIFMNGSWRHIQEKCREHTNKDCKMNSDINR